MPYYHICDDVCPDSCLAAESAFSAGDQFPLLMLFETFPALIVSERAHIRAPLPVYERAYPAPAMLGGRGAMFYSFISRAGERETELRVIKNALAALDIPALVYDGRIFAGGRPCSCGALHTENGSTVHSGVVYYRMPGGLLTACAATREYMSLSDINGGLSRSYVFGAVRYSFELVFGKAEFASAAAVRGAEAVPG